MKPWVTTQEAARRLETTPPTIRTLIEKELLEAAREPRGTGERFRYLVDEEKLNHYLREHGPLAGRRRTRPSRLEKIEHEVSSLRKAVLGQQSAEPRREADDAIRAVERDRDGLRARVVSLEEALALATDVIERQQNIAAEKAMLTEHLVAAVSTAARVDALQRESLAELEEALAAFSRPGHPGEMG